MQPRMRRGNAIIVALSLSSLLGFSALAVDVGVISLQRVELQQALDDAVLSGSGALDGTKEGLARAVVVAAKVASAHEVSGASLSLQRGDLQLGSYGADGTFTRYLDDRDPSTVTALRLSHSSELPIFGLSAIFTGKSARELKTDSRGVRGEGSRYASGVSCYLPLAIGSCAVSNTSGKNPTVTLYAATTTTKLSNGTTRQSTTTSGQLVWMLPAESPVGTAASSQVISPCVGESFSVGDSVYVSQTQNTTPAKTITSILAGTGQVSASKWDSSLYGDVPRNSTASGSTGGSAGATIEGPIPILDAGVQCELLASSKTLKVTGFTWGVIYSAYVSSSSTYLQMLVDITNTHTTWGEGSTTESKTNLRIYGPPEVGPW